MKEAKIIVLDKFKEKTNEERKSILISNIVKLCISEQLKEAKLTE